jgi:hypothetical protein
MAVALPVWVCQALVAWVRKTLAEPELAMEMELEQPLSVLLAARLWYLALLVWACSVCSLLDQPSQAFSHDARDAHRSPRSCPQQSCFDDGPGSGSGSDAPSPAPWIS